MWEEDPHWQEGNYRLLLFAVVLSGIGAIVNSVLFHDWSFLVYWLKFMAVVLSTLALYAAIIWTSAHLIRKIFRGFKHVQQRLKNIASANSPRKTG